jgi:hypothetical protein
VLLRIPTDGGKTLLAAACTIAPAQMKRQRRTGRAVAGANDTITSQTLSAANRQSPTIMRWSAVWHSTMPGLR